MNTKKAESIDSAFLFCTPILNQNGAIFFN